MPIFREFFALVLKVESAGINFVKHIEDSIRQIML